MKIVSKIKFQKALFNPSRLLVLSGGEEEIEAIRIKFAFSRSHGFMDAFLLLKILKFMRMVSSAGITFKKIKKV